MFHSFSATPTLADGVAAVPSDQQQQHARHSAATCQPNNKCQHRHFNPPAPPAAAAGSSPSSATPLGVILVSKDESAERVLFMYPFEPRLLPSSADGGICREDKDVPPPPPLRAARSLPTTAGGGRDASAGSDHPHQQPANNADGTLDDDTPIGLPVKMLAPLLVAKGSNGNGTPFEIKVDNVRFAGFPWHITGCVHSLAVVFILRGSADRHIVDAFQRLSKKIAIAINTEQQRCNYLRDQISLMQPSHDEYEALPDELKKGRCPYEAILEKSGLAKHLRDIFEDVCQYGMVDVFVDDCIEVGFCVEPKALCHAGLASRSAAEIEATMRHIRPYHGLLFLDESIPSPDSNPLVRRFFEEYEPTRSFEELSHLSGIPFGQVLQIVRHYLLWARAMLIYPICTTNVYANAPQQPHNFRTLEAQFVDRFGADCPLTEFLEAFSPMCSLGSFLQDMTIYAGRSALQMSLMVFLLRNQLLVQLHTFLFLLPPPASPFDHSVHQQQHQLAAAANDAMDDQQNVPPPPLAELSQRICALVNTSSELSAALKWHTLDICARVVHAVGVPESEVYRMLRTFMAIVPFLDGRHHMEDIIYQTRLKRSTIMRILDTFADIVCPFYCQDVVIDTDDE